MSKKIAGILFLALIIGVVGCGAKEEAKTPDTMGTKLAQVFVNEIKAGSSITATVDALCKASEFECGSMEVMEGYLNGFSGEVTGFNSGTTFGPYIGSIPFIGYVFETDTPEVLKDTLLSLADPRWNICTEAQETVVEISGNYVFFTMCPGEDF